MPDLVHHARILDLHRAAFAERNRLPEDVLIRITMMVGVVDRYVEILCPVVSTHVKKSVMKGSAGLVKPR